VSDHAGEIDDAQSITHSMPEPEQWLPINGEGNEGQAFPLHCCAEQFAGCQAFAQIFRSSRVEMALPAVHPSDEFQLVTSVGAVGVRDM